MNKLNLNFKKLSPNEDIEIRAYEEALDFAFTEDMTNIVTTATHLYH